eukprot:1161396-Pelagomonas_calceolata.AAC.10
MPETCNPGMGNLREQDESDAEPDECARCSPAQCHLGSVELFCWKEYTGEEKAMTANVVQDRCLLQAYKPLNATLCIAVLNFSPLRLLAGSCAGFTLLVCLQCAGLGPGSRAIGLLQVCSLPAAGTRSFHVVAVSRKTRCSSVAALAL